ncbi:MAG: MauE/DoxX family redox-associated membrane protein [Arachnia sp.]
MSAALVCLTLVIAGILTWSGIAKVRDPQSVETAMRQLRVPAPLAGRAVQRAVPWAEILIAVCVLVLSGPLAVVAWAAAVALFLVYLVLITRAAAQPVRVACNCFGISTAPVTKWTVARNALLAAGAIVGLAGALATPASTVTLLAGLGEMGWTTLVLVALIATAGFALGRDFAGGIADQPVRGAGTAEPIPPAVVEAEPGRPLLLSELPVERPVVLVYLSPTCARCGEVAALIPAWRDRLASHDVVVVTQSRTKVDWLPADIRALAVADVARSVASGLGMTHVPAAAVLGTGGTVDIAPVAGPEAIEAMLNRLSEGSTERR